MFHEPVLLTPAVDLLVTRPDGVYVDGTLGGGGHARAILERLDKPGRLIALDLDEEAVRFANQQLMRKYKNKLVIKQANYKEFNKILHSLNIDKINGILLDLGVSSHQIDTAERGFSFSSTAKLDMRMSKKQSLTAFDIVTTYSEQELARLFREFGEEKRYKSVARMIVKERQRAAICTTRDLQAVVSRALPFQQRVKSLARIFQALRIAVNDELSNLSEVLNTCLDYLAESGRIVVLSYHSLEDRMVKNFFKREAERCVCPPNLPLCVCGHTGRLKILTKRAVQASEQEIQCNPRSRSVRLRAAELLPTVSHTSS
ncbi:MAG: 16S rRNA (cytosine(1402)-N(4))-methyltransferase RsmH [bacterium]